MATLQDTLTILECPICLECPESKPIYQCDKGHIHCNKCHDNIESCPVCRSTFIEIRALVAEQIMERSLPKCRHQNCPVMKLEIQEHESNCLYELVNCPECGQEVTLKDLSEHGKLHGENLETNDVSDTTCNIL